MEDFLKFYIKSLKPLFKNALGPAESRLLHCITNITEKSSRKIERINLIMSLARKFCTTAEKDNHSKCFICSINDLGDVFILILMINTLDRQTSGQRSSLSNPLPRTLHCYSFIIHRIVLYRTQVRKHETSKQTNKLFLSTHPKLFFVCNIAM